MTDPTLGVLGLGWWSARSRSHAPLGLPPVHHLNGHRFRSKGSENEEVHPDDASSVGQ